jgi:demethylmenaquinone methyltransferase/2-methoxy-6-polyprenyl-1,4-benzoquinol methylase
LPLVTPGSASPFTDEGELPTGEAKATAVRSMFDAIAPRYDLVNRIMTFRMDVGWRKKTVRSLGLPVGATVLDIACGTGDLCRELQRPGLRPIGVDLSFGMLAAARTDAPLVHTDALRLPVPDGAVDGVTCGFALRNFVDLEAFVSEVARVVRPGGRIAFLEVAEPPNRFLRWGHGVYFGKVVPRIGALLSDGDAYRYLPKSVAYLPEPEALLGMIRAAGFPDADRTLFSGGISQLLTGTRR